MVMLPTAAPGLVGVVSVMWTSTVAASATGAPKPSAIELRIASLTPRRMGFLPLWLFGDTEP